MHSVTQITGDASDVVIMEKEIIYMYIYIYIRIRKIRDGRWRGWFRECRKMRAAQSLQAIVSGERLFICFEDVNVDRWKESSK